MNRNSLLALILILTTTMFWVQVNMVIKDKPRQLRDLEEDLTELNEQLISAQILANKLDRVYTLFERNLALSKKDSLAEDASMPFMNDLTRVMEELGITLMNIRPREREEKGHFIRSPYDLVIQCTYEQLGKFITEIERSPRLVKVNEFSIRNGVEKIKSNVTEEDLKYQLVEMNLSTLTLVKTRARKVL